MEAMEWSKRNTILLIEYFKEKRELWDSNCEDYKDRVKKQDAWIDLAKKFNTDRNIVERKVRNLIGQFKRELRKSTPGKEVNEIQSKWFGFRLLTFLKDRHKDCSMNKSDIPEIIYTSGGPETDAEEEFDDKNEKTPNEKTNESSLRKRHSKNSDLQNRNKKMLNEFNVLNHISRDKQRKFHQDDEDECKLYAKLLAIKLRHFSHIKRQKIMFEIDNLLLTHSINKHCSSSNFNKSYAIPSPQQILITKSSISECGSYDSSPSSPI
ncbi:uncharacterized protein LOC113512115 [Galleria mellonella]|uniref:Uncharacterized protein LOC113512115 n=1 Tax=Galleria mellonella TaxID=7137 RepID=A0A6J1WEE7_GALME|nr:uncharacterized protein LOC113512115 [Galleria mellonella]